MPLSAVSTCDQDVFSETIRPESGELSVLMTYTNVIFPKKNRIFNDVDVYWHSTIRGRATKYNEVFLIFYIPKYNTKCITRL